MQTGVRHSCNPKPYLRQTLAQWMGCQRFIYNGKVGEDAYFRTFQRHQLDLTGIYPPDDQMYSQFKDAELSPWLFNVPSQILRNGAVRFQQAKSRFKQGLSGRPVYKKKSHRQSVWITDDLFRFVAGEKKGYYSIILGTEAKPIGTLAIKGPLPLVIPKTIVIARQGGKWFTSFSFDDGVPEPDDAAILAHYAGMSADELAGISAGFDRGVAIQIASSNGQQFNFTKQQQAHLERQEGRRQRYQRMMARQVKGSRRNAKTKGQLAREHGKSANIRHEFAEQTSHVLATSATEVFIGEDLKLRNMVKAPAPKPSGKVDKKGNPVYLPNGRAAKSGLAKALLASALGMTWDKLRYKARRLSKLTIKVPAHCSSQECAECGYTHANNRVSQSEFWCQHCQHRDNADHNAARVLEKRGLSMLLNGQIVLPKKKRTMRMAKKGNKKGAEGSDAAAMPVLDPAAATQGPIRVETLVRRGASSQRTAQRSVKRETPSTPC